MTPEERTRETAELQLRLAAALATAEGKGERRAAVAEVRADNIRDISRRNG